MRNERRLVGSALAVGVILSLAFGRAPAAAGRPGTAAARVWVARYVPGDTGRDVVVSHDGTRVFVTGTAVGGPTWDFGTVAYDAATGAQVWAVQYNGPAGADEAYAIAESPDDHVVYVTGYSYSAIGNPDYATVAYEAATGTQLWVARYQGPGNDSDIPSDVDVSPDGTKVFVTGESWGPTAFDYATIAYDAGNGAELWTVRYDGPGHGYDDATAIDVAADGSKVFVTGDSPGADGIDDFATIAYDPANGSPLWTTRFGGEGTSDDAYDIVAAPNGRVFVTGSSFGVYATAAYDATSGQQVWLRTFDGPGFGTNTARSVGVDPTGSLVYVTGTSGGFTGSDFGTIAYNASTGAMVWMNVFNGPGDASDDAQELAVAPDGTKVFVTGNTVSTSNLTDYIAVTYDAATGRRLHLNRFDGAHSYDNPYGIAVAPDSRAFYVTGTTAHQVGGSYLYDYGTVAFRV